MFIPNHDLPGISGPPFLLTLKVLRVLIGINSSRLYNVKII